MDYSEHRNPPLLANAAWYPGSWPRLRDPAAHPVLCRKQQHHPPPMPPKVPTRGLGVTDKDHSWHLYSSAHFPSVSTPTLESVKRAESKAGVIYRV